METECEQTRHEFQPLGSRRVVAEFSGDTITSDAGALLLREVEQATGIIHQFAECFDDQRDPERIEHTVYQLLAQRIYGICMGYEDVNDHDHLRHDPLFALLVGKHDLTGRQRKKPSDQGIPLAGKSTLNRLELSPVAANPGSRYKKIPADIHRVDHFLLDVFFQQHDAPPDSIVLDLDATDDPLHGDQNGRFFHGYYKCYCYLPLYIFCGDHLLCARLRPANIDAALGSVEELTRIVTRVRRHWPQTQITIRGDSGFCRENLMHWCEQNSVDYVLGLAQNNRLKSELTEAMKEAKAEHLQTGEPARRFAEFEYSTLSSWSRERRVVGKAEYLSKGENPRFVVTSLRSEHWEKQTLYKELYCARGEMENRIKEQQNYLFADRTSCEDLRANQLRLYFSSVAYVLMSALRRLGLKGTEGENWQCERIRTRLLKLGARVKVSVRRVYFSLSASWPGRELFGLVHQRLRELNERLAGLIRGSPWIEVL